MDEEFLKIQIWQIMCGSGKSLDEAKAEYAYFNELYKHVGGLTEYLTYMRATQLSYLLDSTMFIEDRKILVEGMIFANNALIILDDDKESLLLSTKEKIKQIKDAYEEFKQSSKYSSYDEFEDSIFKQGIKKYVKRHCKRTDK